MRMLGAPPAVPQLSGRWSRVEAALGSETRRRLADATIAIVGAGRLGSLLAESLAQMGVRRRVVVDPDWVEPSSLDAAALLGPGDIASPKATALSRRLGERTPDVEVHTVTASVATEEARVAILGADLVVSTVDDDGARWAAAVLATLYLRPLLDLGTGIEGDATWRAMGADIRLTSPGEACLLCLGGFARPGQVDALRQGPLSEARTRRVRDWRAERAGSLRSLNLIAAGLAGRILEDLYVGIVPATRWVRFEATSGEAGRIEELAASPIPGCRLCARRGEGDGGLEHPERLPSIATP
jgi:hypothetical protein